MFLSKSKINYLSTKVIEFIKNSKTYRLNQMTSSTVFTFEGHESHHEVEITFINDLKKILIK